MKTYNSQNPDDLRQELLDDVYAGAFSGGMPAMLLEEDEIRNENRNTGRGRAYGRQFGFCH